MVKTTHAAGTGPDTPTPFQLAELHRQIGNGKITRGIMQEFLRGGTESPAWAKAPMPRSIGARYPDLNEAMKIVGQRNFFGPNQWIKRFKKEFSISKAPPIPWTKEQLAEIVSETPHFLFLGTGTLGRNPLTLHNMALRFTSKGHPKLTDAWYRDDLFAHDSVESRWYLIPVGTCVDGGFDEEYVYSKPAARVVANILFHLLNRKYLDSDAWALCAGNTGKGNPIYVRGFSGLLGVEVYKPIGVTRASFSFALDRKVGK